MPIDRKPTDVKKDFTPEEQLERAARGYVRLAKHLKFPRHVVEQTIEIEIKSGMPEIHPRTKSETMLKIAATTCAKDKEEYLQIAKELGFSKQIALIELRNIEQHE